MAPCVHLLQDQISCLTHSILPEKTGEGTGSLAAPALNGKGRPETLRSGPRGREHRKRLPSSPPRGPGFSQGGRGREGGRQNPQACSCCHNGAIEGDVAEDCRGAGRRAQREGAARRIHMTGPDIQGAGRKGLQSGLLTFKSALNATKRSMLDSQHPPMAQALAQPCISLSAPRPEASNACCSRIPRPAAFHILD